MSVRIFDSGRRLLALAATVLVGCSDGGSGPLEPGPDVAVASIRVETPVTTVPLGGSVQLRAMALAADGAELRDRSIAWTTGTPDVVAISTTGQLRALDLGPAVVIASSGGVTRSLELNVVPVPVEQLTLDATTVTLVEGDSVLVSAAVRDGNGAIIPGRSFAWTSSNGGVASTRSGWVRALRAGSSTVTVTSGALSANLRVDVSREISGSLLLVSTDPIAGGQRVYRTDMRDEPTSIQPWQATGTGRHPRISPDSQLVAYSCPEPNTTRSWAICVANVDGTAARMLTGGDEFNEDEPAWSPDGSHLAFRRWAATFGWPGWTLPTDIWTISLDGTRQVNITADASSQHQPVWKPIQVDGIYRITFVQEEIVANQRRTWIASVRPNGTERRNETTPGTQTDLSPAYSPDGRTLLFARALVGGAPELIAQDVITGALRPFLPYTLGGGQAAPTWSPDGRFVAFSSAHDESQSWQVYTVRADGTRLVRRSSGGAGRSQLSWIGEPE